MHTSTTETGKHIFVRILFPFLLGIVLAQFYQTNLLWEQLSFVLLGVLCVGFQFYARGQKWFGLVFFALLLNFGLLLVRFHDVPIPTINTADKTVCVFELTDDFKAGASAYRTEAKLLKQHDSAYAQPPKVLLYFREEDTPKLLPGDYIVAECSMRNISNAGNPHEFDYAGFMARHGVYYSGWVASGFYQKIGSSKGVNLVYFAKRTRQYFLSILQSGPLSAREYAVAAALTLGYKYALDPDTKSAFSHSGAMHILAVSGLHVGVIYGLLAYLFFWKNKHRSYLWAKAILIVLGLWCFAFLTGLSASVCRSALMFSVLAIGEAQGRKSDFFNKLAFTALCLLLYQPNYLFDVGFQLSFAAVASIVFFQPYFQWVFRTENRMLNYLGQTITVSLAAQIGTMGISMYYFHSVPTYFLLTNLFAVLLAGVLVKISVALYALAWVSPYLKMGILWLMKGLLQGLLYGVDFIDSLPRATVSGIWLSGLEVAIYMLGLLALGQWFGGRRIPASWGILVLLCMFFGVHFAFTWQAVHKHEFVVMNVYKHALYVQKEENQVVVWKMPDDELSTETIRWNCENYLMNRRCTQHTLRDINQGEWWHKGFTQIGDRRIFVLSDKRFVQLGTQHPLQVDWLIWSNNLRADLADVLALFRFKKLIIDSSNSTYCAQNVEKECRENGIPFHSVRLSGAFVATTKD